MTKRHKEAVFSCSMLDNFSLCRRKCYYSDIRKLRPKKRNWNLLGGGIIHKALEGWYSSYDATKALKLAQTDAKEIASSGFMSPEDEFERDRYLAMARGFLASYQARYAIEEKGWTPHAVERKFEQVRIETYLFNGVIDLIIADAKGRLVLMDHKSARWIKDDTLCVLPMQFQSVIYPVAASAIAGKNISVMYYNFLQKTGLRLGKKESVAQHLGRITEDIQKRPTEYLIREKINLNAELIKKVGTNLREMCKELTSLIDRGRLAAWYRCPKACNQFGKLCEYFPICFNGERKDVMVKYKVEEV